MKQKRTWALEDHLCAGCGGRILRCVTGGGITGGGNPIWKCANCGKEAADLGPQCLCWCGFNHRGNNNNGYMCQPFSAIEHYPAMREAFLACGCDPSRGEVGIVLVRDLMKARQ